MARTRASIEAPMKIRPDLVINGGLTIIGSGVLTGNTGVIDVNGTFTLSAGAFTAPSTTMSVSGDFAHTGGSVRVFQQNFPCFGLRIAVDAVDRDKVVHGRAAEVRADGAR